MSWNIIYNIINFLCFKKNYVKITKEKHLHSFKSVLGNAFLSFFLSSIRMKISSKQTNTCMSFFLQLWRCTLAIYHLVFVGKCLSCVVRYRFSSKPLLNLSRIFSTFFHRWKSMNMLYFTSWMISSIDRMAVVMLVSNIFVFSFLCLFAYEVAIYCNIVNDKKANNYRNNEIKIKTK